VASHPPVRVDPDVGIPDLIRRLTDDSKRLARDEVRLAKMEMGEAVHTGTRAATWFGLALGVGVVAAVALTIALAALVGRLVNFNYWLGAMLVGAAEALIGIWLIKRGTRQVKEAPFSLPQSRESIRESAQLVRSARAD
jgi:hypothetical protein